ncbi:MAG: glycosyltransferase family 2 protein [Phycisphaerales bacterium]|nr:glycosyltransferase family 2 protein [Phycisphaerales bacterium]
MSPPHFPPHFSVVIPVRNEAKNLPLCLASLEGFDDVVVVDSGSTDETRSIAQQHGCTVLDFKWNGQFPKKRNWTLRNYSFKHQWVLFLDADERMTPAFKNEVEKIIHATPHHGFWIYYTNWFMGRMLKYGDTMRKLALLRIGHGEYERVEEQAWSHLDMEVHEHLIINGTAGAIRARLEHHDLRSLEAYYARHNAYSDWEANRFLALQDPGKLTKRQRIKYQMLTWKIFPFLYFIISYIFKCGFLDGVPGFYFAVGKMFYFYQVQAKILEHRFLSKPQESRQANAK